MELKMQHVATIKSKCGYNLNFTDFLKIIYLFE